MKITLNKFFFSLLIIFLGGCFSSSKKESLVAKSANTKFHAKTFNSTFIKLKPFKEILLDNGLKIYIVKDFSLPRMSLTMLVKVGQKDDPVDKVGLNYFTANLLEQGTKKYSAIEIADELASIGTDLDVSAGVDFTSISIDGLTLSTNRIVEIFSDILKNPSFSKAEFLKIKEQTLAQMKRISDLPAKVADEHINRILFSSLPYAYPEYGTDKTISNLKRSDIIKHFLNYYRPNNSMLAITGAVSDEFENIIISTFKSWQSREIKTYEYRQNFKLDEKNIFVKYKNGLVQSEVRFSMPLFPRNHPDFLKMRIINEIFGGGFTSRLNSSIRDKQGLTYSISSSVDHRLNLGVFDISTFTKTETTLLIIENIKKQLDEFLKNGVTAKELQDSKNLLMGQFPRYIETVDQLAFNLLYLDFYTIPTNYLADYNKNIEKITLEDINQAIKTYFDLDKFKIFVYADVKARNQLNSLNPTVIF